MLLHEDRPHSVPARARLVWKENWFFVFMDPERKLNGLIHLSTEPTNNIAYVSLTLLHDGNVSKKNVAVPLPEKFENQSRLTVGSLVVEFIKAQQEIRLYYQDEEIHLDITMYGRMKLFDFLACHDVNPDHISISESTGFGLGQFRHQGQSMSAKGAVNYREYGKSLKVDGLGYRDHSWGMRNDQLTLSHNWTFINFTDKTFHLFSKRNTIRPEIELREGYVGFSEGNKVLSSLEIHYVGNDDEGMPEKVRFIVADIDNNEYTIIADVGNSFARLPLHLQKDSGKSYYCVENFCNCRIEETGEEGLANVEIGQLIDV